MRTINIFIILIAFLSTKTVAQQDSRSTQTRTIEINNLKGELSISFDDGEITEFSINGEPVSQDQYDNFQELINQFGEDIEINTTPPTPPSTEKSTQLKNEILQFLIDEDIVESATKYKVKLKRKYLKVNGKKMNDIIHQKCLELFDYIYGHHLNHESKVTFSRNGDKSKSSISIVD